MHYRVAKWRKRHFNNVTLGLALIAEVDIVKDIVKIVDHFVNTFTHVYKLSYHKLEPKLILINFHLKTTGYSLYFLVWLISRFSVAVKYLLTLDRSW